MATLSNILARKIPWTEEPGGLHSRGHKESDMTEQACTHLWWGTASRLWRASVVVCSPFRLGVPASPIPVSNNWQGPKAVPYLSFLTSKEDNKTACEEETALSPCWTHSDHSRA